MGEKTSIYLATQINIQGQNALFHNKLMQIQFFLSSIFFAVIQLNIYFSFSCIYLIFLAFS